MHHNSKWQPHQDAVYWIHLARTQDKGLQFWQTRSRAIILYASVPADSIEKEVVFLQGGIFYQRVSTSRPAPKIVLKDTWQSKQQQQGTLSSSRRPLAEENLFGVDLRIKEFHKMQCSKIKEEWPKFKNWWTSCDLNTKQNLSLPT